jgi:hypothetical protein
VEVVGKEQRADCAEVKDNHDLRGSVRLISFLFHSSHLSWLASSWRRIKKDFLNHFHKPRADILVWILTSKLAPTYHNKLDAALIPHGRLRNLPAWRSDMKKAFH